ncbi:hypothetical protein ACIPZ5_05870 [Pseudomonas sp. NPDC089428]|uniref:hypothetical protein n=1 Tax=unclassified Pseudomonas TaxID=196821 RepID=UPI0031E0BFBF
MQYRVYFVDRSGKIEELLLPEEDRKALFMGMSIGDALNYDGFKHGRVSSKTCFYSGPADAPVCSLYSREEAESHANLE